MTGYIMTYTSLVESIIRWVNRTDDTALLAEIPRMIDTGERVTARALKTLMSIRYATDNMTANVNIYQKPSRWLETVSFQIEVAGGQKKELMSRTQEYIKRIYPVDTSTDEPKYFSDFEFNQFFVGPTPNSDYAFQVGYYERPEPLSEDNQQNWLTQNAPDALLYACLKETAPFLINDDRVKMWTEMYDRKLIELVGEDARRLVTRSTKTKKV